MLPTKNKGEKNRPVESSVLSVCPVFQVDKHVTVDEDEVKKSFAITAKESSDFTNLSDDLLLRCQGSIRILRWLNHAEQSYVAKLSGLPTWKYQFYKYEFWTIKPEDSRRVMRVFRCCFVKIGLVGCKQAFMDSKKLFGIFKIFKSSRSMATFSEKTGQPCQLKIAGLHSI